MNCDHETTVLGKPFCLYYEMFICQAEAERPWSHHMMECDQHCHTFITITESENETNE